ncbi:MAG: hypothetical protein WAM14_22140 [Candidatus Nitrosopolaris sp.]
MITIPQGGGIWKLISREGMVEQDGQLPSCQIRLCKKQPVRNNWLGDFPESRSPNNIFSTRKDDSLDLQSDIIGLLRKIRDIRIALVLRCRRLNGVQPMNVGSSGWGTTLGFKRYVCKKCLLTTTFHVKSGGLGYVWCWIKSTNCYD